MLRPIIQAIIATLVGMAVLLGSGRPCAGQSPTMELKLGDRQLTGGPVSWSKNYMMLLGRDGKLWTFAPAEAKEFRKTSSRFEPFSQRDMRDQLRKEYGREFDVTGTGHYLVVHPVGQRDRWAYRFEQLYRSFLHYFTARGWKPQQLQFPLVAVVLPTHEEFYRYAAKDGANVGPGVLGYYSPQTNRVLLYDVTSDNGEESWFINAETIIHEAAHQTAFNTGIHSRYASPPRWVAEGLGTMFEAPGVWNAHRHPDRADRLNKYRLKEFREYAKSRRAQDAMLQLISSDRIFRSDAEAAYAEAWALTFFLSETRPRQYVEYLGRTAERKPGKRYRSNERLAEFTEVFGKDLRMLNAQMLRFVNTLP